VSQWGVAGGVAEKISGSPLWPGGLFRLMQVWKLWCAPIYWQLQGDVIRVIRSGSIVLLTSNLNLVNRFILGPFINARALKSSDSESPSTRIPLVNVTIDKFMVLSSLGEAGRSRASIWGWVLHSRMTKFAALSMHQGI